MDAIREAVDRMIAALNEEEARKHAAQGFTPPPDVWHVKERTKFYALNCRDSGAYMVEKATGELYNIKSYGRPDYNKKLKADLGNVLTADAKVVHEKRWNYLR